MGDGKLVVDRPPERAVVVESRSRLRRLEGLQTRWRGLGVVVLIFLLSRLAFYGAALFGSALVPLFGTNPVRVNVNAPLAIALHWRWDAVHYYSIAVGDYNFYFQNPMPGNQPIVLYAFFPLLPFLTWIAATILGGLRPPAPLPIMAAELSPLLGGVLVVHIATLLAFWLLFQLAREETDEATARRAVLYTAVFPLAFYYALPYAEALFLAASVGTFLAARRRNWVRAGLWAAAASGARPFGILLLPVLALEIVLAWRRDEMQTRDWPRALLGLLLAPVGLLLFMLHLWQRTGDALAFSHAQQMAWLRTPVFPLTTLWRGVGYALHPSWSGTPETYARTVLHTLIVVGFLVVLVASVRRWRPSYVLYGVLLYTLTLSSPWPGETIMHSLGRSVMVLFPVYITLAQWGRRPAIHQAIVLLWLPLFGLLTALYVQWVFVS